MIPDVSDRSIAEIVHSTDGSPSCPAARGGPDWRSPDGSGEAGASVVVTDADQEAADAAARGLASDGRRVVGSV
jgi:hypothetical protein